MSVHSKYSEVKQKAQSYRSTLLSKIYESRFGKMLDAFVWSNYIANRINTLINLNTHKFNIFGNPHFMILPDDTLTTPSDSKMSYIKPYWIGSTETKSVGGVDTELIPIPEFEITPPNVDDMLEDNTRLIADKIYTKTPYDSQDKGWYDFYDLKYGYKLPWYVQYKGKVDATTVNMIPFRGGFDLTNMAGLNGATVETYFEVISGDAYEVALQIKGGIIYSTLFLNCSVEVYMTDITREVRRTINIPVAVYVKGFTSYDEFWVVLPDGNELYLRDPYVVGVHLNFTQYNGIPGLIKVARSLETGSGWDQL